MKESKRISTQRKRRAYRVRNKIRAITTRPRLSVFRSNKHIYAQIIDDAAGRTLASACTLDAELDGQFSNGGNAAAAAAVGKLLAGRALAAGVKEAAFDRREYKYHGRVASLADAARDAGLGLGAKKVVEAKPEPKAKSDKKKDGGAKGEGEKKPKEKKPKQAGSEAKA